MAIRTRSSSGPVTATTRSAPDAGLDILDLGGASYDVTETSEGTLITLDASSTILIYGTYDILRIRSVRTPPRAAS